MAAEHPQPAGQQADDDIGRKMYLQVEPGQRHPHRTEHRQAEGQAAPGGRREQGQDQQAGGSLQGMGTGKGRIARQRTDQLVQAGPGRWTQYLKP